MVKRKVMLVVLTLGALLVPAGAVAVALHHPRASVAKRVLPTAKLSSGVPRLGALYASDRATQHGCTATVIHSPAGNMLSTTAHCVVRSGAGMVFAPGQHGDRTPYGRWIIRAAYFESAWLKRQDPDADIAFLTVAPRTINGVSTEVEQVTGAYSLGSTGAPGQRVTVTGYPAGSSDDPITCAARIYRTGRFPAFDCRGFVDGTSGSPWLRSTRHGMQIVGVIGGLHQGGCEDYTSYSSSLGRGALAAYRRASRGVGGGDVGPRRRGDGC